MANLPYSDRDLIWIGDSREAISAFPKPAREICGFALRQVQNGATPEIAKPLSSFGSGVYELAAATGGEAYRVVYVVKLKKAVYVLDAFVKKSKKGRAIPKEIRERIALRLKFAKAHDAGRQP